MSFERGDTFWIGVLLHGYIGAGFALLCFAGIGLDYTSTGVGFVSVYPVLPFSWLDGFLGFGYMWKPCRQRFPWGYFCT
jgi:hypothetical protein